LQVATLGLVWSFFLNGVVFWSSRSGGKWGFPTQNMPAIGFKAGGSMAGFAQLGIVVVVVGRGQGNPQGPVFGAGW